MIDDIIVDERQISRALLELTFLGKNQYRYLYLPKQS